MTHSFPTRRSSDLLKRLSDPLDESIGLVDLEAPRGDQLGRGVIVKDDGLPGIAIGLGHQLVEADRSMLDPAARPILARVCADNWWHRHSTTVGYAVAKHFTLIRWPRWRRLRSRGSGTDLGLDAADAGGNVLIVAPTNN